jgi:hypothetical protein
MIVEIRRREGLEMLDVGIKMMGGIRWEDKYI